MERTVVGSGSPNSLASGGIGLDRCREGLLSILHQNPEEEVLSSAFGGLLRKIKRTKSGQALIIQNQLLELTFL